MGAAVDYLLKDRRTGRLSFRRTFPPEFRAHIPGRPRELKRSLGATSINAAGAVERFRQAGIEYDQIMAKARKVAAGVFDALGLERMAWLVDTYTHTRLAQDDEARFDLDDSRFELETLSSFRMAPMGFMDGATRREKALAGLPLVVADLRDAYGTGDANRTIQIEGQAAEDLLEANGLRIDHASDEFGALCRRLLVADISLACDLLVRFQGEPVPTPPAPPIETQTPSHRAAPEWPRETGASFQTMAESLIANARLAISPTTQEALESS